MINGWSRLAIDPERFLDPAEEEMEAVNMGAVYTRTSNGRLLRDLEPSQRADLLDRHFHPYHVALTRLVGDHLDQHGHCMLIDLHSYPRDPLPYELHAAGQRPEIDIGTDQHHTPSWLRQQVIDLVTDAGLGHAENTPFAGTFVPTRYLGDPRVSSIMLEIRRDTYLNEATARRRGTDPRPRHPPGRTAGSCTMTGTPARCPTSA